MRAVIDLAPSWASPLRKEHIMDPVSFSEWVADVPPMAPWMAQDRVSHTRETSEGDHFTYRTRGTRRNPEGKVYEYVIPQDSHTYPNTTVNEFRWFGLLYGMYLAFCDRKGIEPGPVEDVFHDEDE